MPDIRLHLSDELMAEVDDARGSVARVRWIRDLIEQRLDRVAELRAADTFATTQSRKTKGAAQPPKTPPSGFCQHNSTTWHPYGTICNDCGRRIS